MKRRRLAPIIAQIIVLVLLLASGGYRLARGAASSLVLTTTAVGAGLFVAVLDEENSRFYIHTSGDDGSLRVVDTRTGAGEQPVDAITESNSPVVDDRLHRALGNSPAGALELIDNRTFQVLRTLPIDTSSAFFTLDKVGGVFYVIDQSNRMSIVDLRFGKITEQFPTCAPGSENAVISHATGHLFMQCDSGRTEVRDARSGRLLRIIDTRGLGPCTCRSVGDERTGRVFVPGSRATGVLDARTGALLHTLPIPTWGGAMFELDKDAGGAIDVDEETGNVVIAPYRARAAPSRQVLLLDGYSGRVLRRLAVPENPTAVLINPLTDHLLVTSAGPVDGDGDPLGDGTLSVLDMKTGAMVRQVQLGILPAGLFADERARRLIVVNYTSAMNQSMLHRTYSDGITSQTLRRLKGAMPWLPFSGPEPLAPPTDVTVMTLDLAAL